MTVYSPEILRTRCNEMSFLIMWSSSSIKIANHLSVSIKMTNSHVIGCMSLVDFFVVTVAARFMARLNRLAKFLKDFLKKSGQEHLLENPETANDPMVHLGIIADQKYVNPEAFLETMFIQEALWCLEGRHNCRHVVAAMIIANWERYFLCLIKLAREVKASHIATALQADYDEFSEFATHLFR